MLQKIGDIVKTTSRNQLQDHRHKDFIYKLFRQALVDLRLSHLNPYIEIKSYKEGILTITSAEGIWVQEVYLRQAKIKQYMNKQLGGEERINHIKVAVVGR